MKPVFSDTTIVQLYLLSPDSSLISILLHLETVRGTFQLKTTTCALVKRDTSKDGLGSLTYKHNPVRISGSLSQACRVCDNQQQQGCINVPNSQWNVPRGIKLPKRNQSPKRHPNDSCQLKRPTVIKICRPEGL